MTADELQFYYFKQHDYDNNNKLDGIELIQGETPNNIRKKKPIYGNMRDFCAYKL